MIHYHMLFTSELATSPRHNNNNNAMTKDTKPAYGSHEDR